jgi:hypothetical protein
VLSHISEQRNSQRNSKLFSLSRCSSISAENGGNADFPGSNFSEEYLLKTAAMYMKHTRDIQERAAKSAGTVGKTTTTTTTATKFDSKFY